MQTYKIAIALIAVGTTALAHGGVKNKDVLARMEGMTALADQVKVIGRMMKGEAAFHAAAANAALQAISDEAESIPALFETEAQDPKSETLPLVWEEFDDFEQQALRLERSTAELSGSISDPADLRPAMKAVSAACSGCHEVYRE